MMNEPQPQILGARPMAERVHRWPASAMSRNRQRLIDLRVSRRDGNLSRYESRLGGWDHPILLKPPSCTLVADSHHEDQVTLFVPAHPSGLPFGQYQTIFWEISIGRRPVRHGDRQRSRLRRQSPSDVDTTTQQLLLPGGNHNQ